MKRRPLPATCRDSIGERSGVEVLTSIFFFLYLFRFVFSQEKSNLNGDSLPLGGSPRRNGDGSIGGSRQRRKMEICLSVALLDQRKRRPLSIGGSLRRRTMASVAAKANRKVKALVIYVYVSIFQVCMT